MRLPATSPTLAAHVLVGAAIALLYNGSLAWHESHEALAFSFVAAAGVCCAGGVMLRWPAALVILDQRVWKQVTVAWLLVIGAWSVVLGAVLLSYSNSGWDESAYLLSGLALRGFATPYAAHRPPVTHFIAAAFADQPALGVVVLTLSLLSLMSTWGVRRWNAAVGLLPIALLAFQNVFLEALLGLVSELPAALLLFGGFFLFSRQRFAAAGAVFALAGLTRWNLAVVPLILTFIVALRFGCKPAAQMAWGGALIATLFLVASSAFVHRPIQRIIEGNLQPAWAWAGKGDTAPDFFSRFLFYSSHAFFITPPALLAMASYLANIPHRSNQATEDWCIRVAMPLCFATYATVMLTIGGHFPRFMAPFIPVAMFVLSDYLLVTSERDSPRPRALRAWPVLMACIAVGFGIWPASVLINARNMARHHNTLSDALLSELPGRVPRDACVVAPPIEPLSQSNGFPLMVELRRSIHFPTAARERTGEIVADPDVLHAVELLRRNTPEGCFMVLPQEFSGSTGEDSRIAGHGRWVFIRRGNPARQ